MLTFFNDYFLRLVNGANFIITMVFYCAMIVYVFDDNKRWWVKLLDLFGTFIAAFLLSSIFIWITSSTYPPAGRYMPMAVWPILVLIHAFVLNDFVWFDRVAKGLTLGSLILVSLKISYVFGNFIAPFQTEHPILQYGATIIVLLVLSVMTWLIQRYDLENFSSIQPSFLWVLLASSFTLYLITLLDNINIEIGTFNSFLFFTYLGLWLITIASYISFYLVTEKYNKMLDEQAKLLKADMDEKMISMAQSNLEETRKIRHDLKNQYGYMKLLLENKDFERLSLFFSDMQESAMIPLSFVDVGNPVVTSILNTEISKARANGISIDHDIVVPASFKKIRDVDLCSLLFNALDNAIEYVNHNSLGAVHIKFSLRMEKDYLVVRITNPLAQSAQGAVSLQTWKSDKDYHGYGLKIIRGIASKYEGEATFTSQDGNFVFRAMLLDKGEDNG